MAGRSKRTSASISLILSTTLILDASNSQSTIQKNTKSSRGSSSNERTYGSSSAIQLARFFASRFPHLCLRDDLSSRQLGHSCSLSTKMSCMFSFFFFALLETANCQNEGGWRFRTHPSHPIPSSLRVCSNKRNFIFIFPSLAHWHKFSVSSEAKSPYLHPNVETQQLKVLTLCCQLRRSLSFDFTDIKYSIPPVIYILHVLRLLMAP